MSRSEVDALLAGYPPEEWRQKQDLYAKRRPMLRPSVLTVGYEDKPRANEGDHLIRAYFDKDGRLVSKDFSQYAK